MQQKFPVITALLAASILIVHFLLSSEFLFARPESIAQLGFSLFQPLNIITFSFVHVDYSHMLVNAAAIIAAGTVVESILGKKHVLVLFFAGSATAAIWLAFSSPAFSAVGASGGAGALLAAAFALDTKGSALKAIACLAIALGIILAGNIYIENESRQIAQQTQTLEESKEKALARNDFITAQQASEQINMNAEKSRAIESGIEQKKAIPPNMEMHAAAAIFGALYAYFSARARVAQNAHKLFSFAKGG